MELAKGANAPVSNNQVKLVLSWSGGVDVDVAALLCTSAGKVRNDDDFIFYNQPRHRSNAVAHSGKVSGGVWTDTLGIDLGLVEPDIEKIVISGSADGGNFGQLSGLALAVVDAQTSTQLIRFAIPGATVETAMIAGELYRRNGAWKFRAIGQGYSTGLRGVALDFGISVDDEPAQQTQSQAIVPVYSQPQVHPQYATSAQYAEPSQPAYQPQYAQHPAPVPTYAPLAGYAPSAAPAYAPPQAPEPQMSDTEDDNEEEVTLQPFPTKNPYLKKVFTMKEFGRAPGRAIAVYRERVIDPEEKMIAAFKSKHGQYKWGYLVLTSHALRWFQTMPTRDEDLWSWDDVGLNGSVVVCENWQYQLKGFGAGRKFKALMLVLAQSEGWEKNH